MEAHSPDSPEAPSSDALARAIAESVLKLRGADAAAFAEQFCALAARPLTVALAGDGETYRQALCFPILAAEGGGLVPVPGVAPHLIVELPSRHLVCLRLADAPSARFAPGALLRSLAHALERLPQGQGAWAGIEKSIAMTSRRRVQLADFQLEPDVAWFWQQGFPKGEEFLADKLFRGMPPVHGRARKEAVAALAGIQSDAFRDAMAKFVGGIDAQILRAIRASGLPVAVSRYNTYLRGEAVHAARNRIQAADAAPLLGCLLGEETQRAARLRRLVDAGQPLWPALADTVGVPEETARWMRGKTVDDVSEAWLGHIPELLHTLAVVPLQKRPRSRDEWTAFTDFALTMRRLPESERETAWMQDLARIGWIEARQKFDNLGAAPSDLHEIEDVLREIAGAVAGELLPHLPRYGHGDSLEYRRLRHKVEEVFFSLSVLKQIRTSQRWHALQLLPPDEEPPDEADGASPVSHLQHWPAPVAEPVSLGALTAHFLTTPAQLRGEGLRMKHCVGSYSTRCLFDGANIVSFRARDGRSISTAELRLRPRGENLVFDVVQHKALANGAPGADAEKALARLLQRLAGDDMQPRLQEMQKQLAARRALDDRRHEWLADTPRAPHRLRALKAALKLHGGYDRFVEACRQGLAGLRGR